MKTLLHLFTAVSLLVASNARAQLAITETLSSASTNLGPTTVTQGPDFWELTNFGTNTIDLTGYIFNDSDATRGGDADATTLSGISIGPGESIVLVQNGVAAVSTREDFINWWGAANLPTNLQVLFYTGNGQSSSGDSIVLWAPTATSDAEWVDRADYGEAARGHSFTYHPTNGTYGVISSNGIGGAFKASTADDEGSPGKTTGTVALKILQQPTPTAYTAPASGNVTFVAAAQGLPHPHYQWRHNGTNLDGAIQPSLTVSNVQSTDAGTYVVLVTNGLQSLTSSNAVLTVTTTPVEPSFTILPVAADAFVGQTVHFNAQAIGSPTPSLQWRKDGVTIGGATGSQLTLYNVQTNDAGLYTVAATSPAGSNGVAVPLTVGAKPQLLITEVHPSGSGESGHQDWWELTSFDTRTLNLKGWRWDDNSHSVAPGNAYVFTNDIYIHPGESMVFVENMTPSAYRAWWGTNLPASLQIITYIGGGLGLSQTADEVNLWNAVTLVGNELTERVCGVNFAASYVGSTLVYDPENLPVAGVFGTFSTNTVAGKAANGIFAAADKGAFGSPGYVVAPIQLASYFTGSELLLSWNSVASRNYTVEYKTSLASPTWSTISNLTATAANTTISVNPAATAGFYRAATIIPLVLEP